MIALHRAVDRHFKPWKNGGGDTAEILCQPEGAGFDDFQWRISTARVASSGPFSIFPGVARLLTVLEGGPMRLQVDGRDILATPESGPVAFRGDLPCTATLTGAAVLDLNVMTRAPFAARVYTAGAKGDAAPVDARYLLALADLPARGMARLDLAQLGTGDRPVQGAGLVIDILRL